MVKLILKIAVMVLLVLSGVALVLGVKLFTQREMLKGRTQKLETAIKQIATTVEAGDASSDKVIIADDQLKTYKVVPGGPPTMEVPLNQLVSAAQNQLVRLNTTRSDLADTKATLVKTQAELKSTQTALAAEKKKTEELTQTVAAREATIEEKNTAIRTLENEKTDLAFQVETMKSQVEELEVQTRDLGDENVFLKDRVSKLECELYPDLAKAKMIKGSQGVVCYVNSDWNFIIFTISPECLKKIFPKTELLIQRGDQLIGKVRIANIVENLAIAEIVPDFIPRDWNQQSRQNQAVQFTMRKGDYVIY